MYTNECWFCDFLLLCSDGMTQDALHFFPLNRCCSFGIIIKFACGVTNLLI